MPVHGIDHLLSALAVGLIASRATGSMRYKLPGLFALITLLGGFLNLGGLNLPELAVPFTVAAAGVLLWKSTPAVTAGILLAALAGLANGQALIEVPPTTLSSAVFAAGCLLSALSVCSLGFGLGRALLHKPLAARFAGASLLASAALLTLFPALNAALIRCIE
jgi:hydrogenase/urease accessory protein HupE